LIRYRFHLIQAVSREKAYFLTHLYLKFSAFSVEKPFASLLGATSLALINEFCPDEIVRLLLEHLTQFIIKNGKNCSKDPDEIVKALQRVARKPYRLRAALSSSTNLILATILKTLRALGEAFKEVDKTIEKEFQVFPNTPQSIKIIGPVYSGGIFSEIEDIRRFHTEDAMANFAGLTWKQYQSRNFEVEKTHMRKPEMSISRYYLIEASNALRVPNAEYKAYYENKFKGGYQTPSQKGPGLNSKKAVEGCLFLP
jgi:hypothetical protein